MLYGLKSMCAKFDAFMRFVTIFPFMDGTINGQENTPVVWKKNDVNSEKDLSDHKLRVLLKHKRS